MTATVTGQPGVPAQAEGQHEDAARVMADLNPGTAPQQAQPPAGRPVIATCLLAAHPGNVRRDQDPDEEFLASVTELGILTPLRITPGGDGAYRVIEGHRRLAAAVRLGLTEVPCDLAAGRDGDDAGQFLDMYAANHHRKSLTPMEEADALFSASQAGASKTRIRKATGLPSQKVSAALAAGRLTGQARDSAHALGYEVTLEQIALLAEFDNDEEAVSLIVSEISKGRSGEHAAARIRQQRADAAAHGELVVWLRGEGYAISDELPDGALLLYFLEQDGQALTAESHASCPGRGVFFRSWQPLDPVHYCTSPDEQGHARRFQAQPLSLGNGGTGAGPAMPGAGTGDSPAPDPARRLVIEGNRAWTAAGTVRQEWLKNKLLSRRTAPREAMGFITSQLLTMPMVLRTALTAAPFTQMFHDLAGGLKPEAAAAWPASRQPLAVLAVITAAYEEKMSGDAGKATWRPGRPSPCSREEAGSYFRFLATAGYELSAIEQAVADGADYAGDQPGDRLITGDEPDGGVDDTPGAAEAADDETGHAGAGSPDGDAQNAPGQDAAA